MPKRVDELLVRDMQESFSAILEYTKNLAFEDFNSNRLIKDAVIRNFEIIGEASNLLSEEFKHTYPQVEWRKISDFRNRLIHEYFGINYKIVWDIIVEEVQQHLEFLATIENI